VEVGKGVGFLVTAGVGTGISVPLSVYETIGRSSSSSCTSAPFNETLIFKFCAPPNAERGTPDGLDTYNPFFPFSHYVKIFIISRSLFS
jgi:hypothetical protein